ncbi:hypothetical protein NOVO_00930 [Rickettsiales bacterium Ac37b]|nr:hypothetical protein NOVO_00930 [Rickettsiales bacterium Ac37b]
MTQKVKNRDKMKSLDEIKGKNATYCTMDREAYNILQRELNSKLKDFNIYKTSMQNNNSFSEADATKLINEREKSIYLGVMEFLQNHSKQTKVFPEIVSENEAIIASFIDKVGFHLYHITFDDEVEFLYEVESTIIL